MLKFGTSGFRGVIADTFCKENIQKIAFALAKISKTNKPISIGFDNRFMGQTFARWFCEVLIGCGKKVIVYTCPVPSPLIANATKNQEFGVMITASHNPYYYNGIKIFEQGGIDLSPQNATLIEKIANKIKIKNIKTISYQEGLDKKFVSESCDITTYCDGLLKQVDVAKIKKAKLNVAFNNMHGSGLGCVKYVFDKLGVKLAIINENVDPYFNFVQPVPYAENLGDITKLTKSTKNHDFGFALDGDGDRVSFIDENGKFYDCNYISALIYENYCNTKKRGIFVKNCAMTTLLDKIANTYKQNLEVANTGFKNTAQKMLATKAVIGAESNGIAFKGHILYKDGLFATLKLMEVLAEHKIPFGEQIKQLKQNYNYPCHIVEKSYAINENIRKNLERTLFEQKSLPQINKHQIDVLYTKDVKIIYEKGYWVVLRFSGTEDVFRIFAEMPTEKQAEYVVKTFANFLNLE